MSGSPTEKAGNPNRVEWEVPTTHLLKGTTHGKHNNRLHDWRENACGFQCFELEFRSGVSFFLPLQRRRYDQFSGKQRTRFRSHASAFVDRKKGKEVDHLPSPFCSPAKRAFSSSGVVKEKVDGACGDPEIWKTNPTDRGLTIGRLSFGFPNIPGHALDNSSSLTNP